jgi:hypothetical protein
MVSIRQVLLFNDQGIQLFSARDFAASALAFQSAAAMLRASFDQAMEISSGHHVKLCPSDRREEDLCNVVNSFNSNGSQSNATGLELYGDGYFVHDRPLILSSFMPEFASYDDMDGFLNVASCVTLFNMALAWHWQGLTCSDGRETQPWTSAVMLYDSVLDIVDTAPLDHNVAYNVVACLALNNLAHLYLECGEYAACMAVGGYLDEILLSSLDMMESNMGIEVVNEIQLNRMRLASLSAATAA